MPSLQLLIKPSSSMCSLRCQYCFYRDITEKREVANYGFMSFDTLDQVVKKAFEYADQAVDFAFQGGEPTLVGLDFYEGFTQLVELYNTKQLPAQYSIQTNGYHLGEEWGEFLYAHQFLVGLSIDGVMATHDAYRKNALGQGTFGDIMETAQMFERNHVEYNVLTVVNGKTAGKIRRIYEFYKKHHFRYLQFIACLDPLGEKPGGHAYSLTPEAYGQFLIDLFELWYLDLMHGEQPYIRQFENYVAILMGYEPESCEQRGICSIQHVVEADGSVYPCDFYVTDEYRLGNLNEDDFETIGRRGIESGFIGRCVQRESCQRCQYFRICRGGCGRHCMTGENSAYGENYFCKSYQMFFDVAYQRLKEIAEQLKEPMRRR